MTENNQDLITLMNDDDITSPTTYNAKLEKTMNKLKFKAFGKVSFSSRPAVDKPLGRLYQQKEALNNNSEDGDKIMEVEKKIAELLIQNQRTDYERKLATLKDLKNTKGKSAAVFNLKAKVLGGKKANQEAVVIKDPITKELVFEAEKIQETSLNYLKNLLTNKEPKDDYKKDLKVINIMHEVRMEENVKDDEQFTNEDCGNLLKHLHKNNKSKYKFILN